jgi:hypothetical protein
MIGILCTRFNWTHVQRKSVHFVVLHNTFSCTQVLLCDGIVGLTNSDGGKRPGGLGSMTLDARRTMLHPSKFATEELLEKRSISGLDYCGAGLEGGGMKRKLLLQPELREAVARLSQHRPTDEKLGPRLSKAGFLSLLDGLAHEDPRVVKGIGPGEAEGPLPEDGKRRLLTEQQTMVRDRNLAVYELLRGIQADFEARGMNPNLWESWVEEWTELLYSLGAHDSDEDLIGGAALGVIRKLLLGGEASLEDRRQMGEAVPILRRILDAYGGLTFPAFFMGTLHQLYLLTLAARGTTGFEVEGEFRWVYQTIRPFDEAVWLLREARRRPLSQEESGRLEKACALANELLPGVKNLAPSPQQWRSVSERQRGLLWDRLGRDEEGVELHPLPKEHALRVEQDALAHYSFLGWEQKRGLPQYSSFEHSDGCSQSSEEFKCATGRSITDWDSENVPGLVKGGGKGGKKGGGAAKRPNRSRGVFVFCCSHRLIYGF